MIALCERGYARETNPLDGFAGLIQDWNGPAAGA